MAEANFFAAMLDRLIDTNRKPDGSKFTYADIQEGTGGAVSAEYVRQLHQGKAENPGYGVIEALSAFFQVSPADFFPAMRFRNDRFFRQIIVGLSGPFNMDTFEACVVDLIQKEHPGLVPIPGGKDMGMDGAFPFGGEAFCPLIVTSSKDVEGNLKRNLTSYINQKIPFRKVILATSQPLKQPQRKKLFEIAEDLGFSLAAPPYDQVAIAYRLYRHPKWCKELLGISGTPPALSVIPRRAGYFFDIEPVGREEDYTWLTETTGDRLLVGEPGVGKTFLLQKMALEEMALFVVDADSAAIANDIRELNPDVLIVDDAHLYPEIIERLQQIRTELDAEFNILATCWPNFRSPVADKLKIPDNRQHHLERLNRTKMAEAIKAMGLKGPDGHIAFILDQVGGRPGLAASLVWTYLQGDWIKLNSGEKLADATLQVIENHERRQTAKAILASFSLGGKAGMNQTDIANHLGISIAELWSLVTDLASCGVVNIRGNNVVVHPGILREALVRDVFFTNTLLKPDGLIASASDTDQLALTLMGTKVRGGAVSIELIIEILERCFSNQTWEAFAGLGEHETKWVIENHPERLLDIAPAALEKAPTKVIPLLLQNAVIDERPLHSYSDHPLKRLETWILAARPGTKQTVFRRRILLDTLINWFQNGKDTLVGLRAFRIVFSPSFQKAETHPIEKSKIAFYSGLFSNEELKEIWSWWEEALDLISSINIEPENWKVIIELIEDWAYLGRYPGTIPQETSTLMERIASQMIQQLAPLVENRPGLLLQIERMAAHLELNLAFEIPHEFQLLYGHDLQGEYEEWEQDEKKRQIEIRGLAGEWAKESPETIAKRISSLESEAQPVSNQHSYRMRLLCSEISANTEKPQEWIEAFQAAGLPSELLSPFVTRLAQINRDLFEEMANQRLDDPELSRHFQWEVLHLENPSEDLLNKVIVRLSQQQGILEELIWRGVSAKATKGLLLSDNPSVAFSAALSVWNTEPPGNIPPDLIENWRKAIIQADVTTLTSSSREHNLERILLSDLSLSFAWLKARVSESADYFHVQDLLAKVASILDFDQRDELIILVPNEYYLKGLVAALVKDNVELYRKLLGRDLTKDIHLAPISKSPEGAWYEMAILCLERGYSADDIAFAVIYQLSGVIDAHSEAWEKQIERFDDLCRHENTMIREVGVAGKSYAEERRDRARDEERLRDVYGYDVY